MAITIISLEKNGPIITCYTDDERAYKVNFDKCAAYGTNNKQLKSVKTIYEKLSTELIRNQPILTSVLSYLSAEHTAQEWGIAESLLSYPDLLSKGIEQSFIRYLVNNHEGKLPKGFVSWCRAHDCAFNTSSIIDFDEECIYNSWPEHTRLIAQKLAEGSGINLTNYTTDAVYATQLIRIIQNSIKRYELKNISADLANIAHTVREYPRLRSFIDDTKSLSVQRKILEQAKKDEANKQVIEQEARFLPLQGMKVDNLIIKVPTQIEDFHDEGAQQHNCVGHYYHNRIREGNTFIYFLRLPDLPDKSCLTCRAVYNRCNEAWETAEHRLCRNEWYNNDELFEKIDQLINQLGIGYTEV